MLKTCTTILVGKNASLTGSTIIARNEDGADDSNAQRFVVVNPEDQPQPYHSVHSDLTIPLPDNPLRYTATPDADPTYGIWGAGGINSKNTAMTATETITTNARVLSVDPLVEKGLGEEDFLTLVLPYIESAKAGVLRLGKLLEEYGTYESNGIAFADREEIWYMETIGGHHWAAIRIPDDVYAIAPNRWNITDFDFDSADCLAPADLPELIAKNQLNPDHEGFNLRHIFGSATIKDRYYNNPRAWYVHQFLDDNFVGEPTDQDLPFINRATKKISVEDLKFLLSSHYQETSYDPYGETVPEKRFRPIGINRNLETHILELRNQVPDEIAGIHWLAFGPNTFNAMVPFYSNVADTPACYRDTPTVVNTNYMYWISRVLALIGDGNFALYQDLQENFAQTVLQNVLRMQKETDRQATLTEKNLTSANQAMADFTLAQATKLLNDAINLGSHNMKLRFSLGD
ncbi:C69 family dipeptidase [Pediococcus acidilactici]|uniref:C69 family dipeptidase n=1 Tax=Pediococcus acidilactici TaxID=1254 RepID=UPI002F26D24F